MQKIVVSPANLIIGESANEIEMLLGVGTGTIFMEADEDEDDEESDDEESDDEELDDEESDDEESDDEESDDESDDEA
jgi:hypothetical protein